MVELDVLNADTMGSSDDRLKEIFTATPPSPDEEAKFTDEQKERSESNLAWRRCWEEEIWNQFSTQIEYAMTNSPMYSAVDLAWDAAPINKSTVPLLLYAQGRLDVGQCARAISGIPGHDKYTTKDAKGNITSIDVPKFFEVNFNLVRSVVGRRLAAQSNKYRSLHPCYKYEPRGTSTVAKLRADVLSQVVDIMADGYDARHHDDQVFRDTMLYAHSVDFVRAKWERETQLIFDPDVNPELKDDKNPKFRPVIVKEGLAFVNPHPTRIFWDNAHPLSTINSDTGCEFIGYWDVARYGSVADNPHYWNRKNITWNSSMFQLFNTYTNYSNQYLCTIKPPCDSTSFDLAAANDRKNQLGLYAATQKDCSMLLGYYFKKIIPKDWGIGKYPHPVWLRLVVAGAQTVVHAEFLPSSPACYCGINENDSRQANISIAMELMPYQDQLSQLLSLLLQTIQSTNFKVLVINTDIADPESIKQFRLAAESKTRLPNVHVFEYSAAKMEQALPGFNIKSFIDLIQTEPSNAITVIFQAIGQLVQLAERLMALSPNELGQPAPREISANESNLIAATTETIYAFISSAIDEFRAAKKRIIYESYMVCGSQEIRVPVLNRYTKATIQKAGFEVEDEDAESDAIVDPGKPTYHTIVGTKSKLAYHYVFTSRDGAHRPVNTEAGNILVQLLNLIFSQPDIRQKVGMGKLYAMMNEVFRLSGAGVDLKLELAEGESDQIGPDKQAQMEQILQMLTQYTESNTQGVQQLSQQFEELKSIVEELVGKVDEIDRRPPQEMVNPLEIAKSAQDLEMASAEGTQKLAMGELGLENQRQRMMQGAEKHSVDMALKLMKPAAEKNGE